MAFFNAFGGEKARKEALADAQMETAAEIIIPLYDKIAEALKAAGLPVQDVLIISKDGELHDFEMYNLDIKDYEDDDDDDDDDDEEEEEYDGKECLVLLKKHLKDEKITFEEAADELDVAKATIKKWMDQDLRKSNVRTPGQENCAMILDYMGMEY